MSRTAAILAAAALADKELERERLRGQREGATSEAWSGLAQTLVNAVPGVLDRVKAGAEDDANTAAERLVAEHAGDLGNMNDSAGAWAKRETDPLEHLASGGGFAGLMGGDAAAKKARAAAEAKIASNVIANRDKFDAKRKQDLADRSAGDAAAYARSRDAAGDKRQAELDAYAREKDTQARVQHDNDTEAARAEREQARMDAAQAKADAAGLAYDTGEKNRAAQIEIAGMRGGRRGGDASRPDSPSTTPPGFRPDKATIKKAQDVHKSAQDAIDEANNILVQLDDPNVSKFVGPIVGRYYKAKQDLGFASDAAGVRADLGDSFNLYKHAITGAAMTVKEAPDIIKVAPNDIDDDASNIRAKLQAGIAHAQRQMAQADAILGNGDIRAKAGASPPPAASMATSPAQHGASGSWAADLGAQMDKALQPAMTGSSPRPSSRPAGPAVDVDAARTFRAMTAPQQAKVRALIAQGVDRATATMRVAQGG